MVAGCRGSLLTKQGKEGGVRTDLAILMTAGRQQHERMVAQG
jgi:hypothetical protein